MSTILMSIKPRYVDLILNGIKKYEYRTIKPKHNIDKIIIYSSFPVKKVVGEILVDDIIEDTPINIWNNTYMYSGTTKEFFFNYFKNKDIAYAYKIRSVKIYDKPKDLIDYGVKNSPQSYIYIKE